VLWELLYERLVATKPYEAHRVLASWEARGLLKRMKTQNIDSVQ
jgi:NAD-dependent SIR2 family protein deacetylase